MAFSNLERNILTAKGLSAEQVEGLTSLGVTSREDLLTIGDPETLRQLAPSISAEVADRVISWATGRAAAAAAASGGLPFGGGKVLLDTADVVYCVHCSAKQPKDYSSGDLCVACGRQAEPIQTCYWCRSAGPGAYCRACGARHIPPAEFELGILLKQEGLAKDEIPVRLESMTAAEKDVLWGRARRRKV